MTRIKEYILRILPRDRKQIVVFGICVIISSFAWLLLTLSRNYQEFVTVDLKFENLPKNEMLIGELPQQFGVKVKATGFELLVNSLGFKTKEITIKGADLRFKKQGSLKLYYWLAKENSSKVKSAFDEDIQLNGFVKDSVKLYFSALVEKTIPIKLNINAQLQEEFFSVGIPLLDPEVVKVRGAKSVLEKMDSISTNLIELENVDGNIDMDVYPMYVPGIFQINPDTVRLFVEVQPLKEFTIEVPISVVNIPDSLEIKLFPENVEVMFSCGFNQFSQVFPGTFKANIDFNQQSESGDKLPVNLIEVPGFSKNVSISPAKVEYIIRSKK